MRNTRNLPRSPLQFWIVVAVALVASLDTAAQAPPATDVYLSALTTGGNGIQLGPPINVTRRAGYDNQPCFLGEGDRLLYTSIGDDGQADIWIYDLESRQRIRLTETPESEYSPTPIPGEDAISVVRVESDGTQRLWRFPLQGGKPDLLLPEVKPVGYHAWSGSRRAGRPTANQDLLLFVLGEPNTLQHARRGDGLGKVLAENIGRALHPIPGSDRVAFVHKLSAERWVIRSVDPTGGEPATLIETLGGREDFAWSPSGTLWMGDGSALYVANLDQGDGWRQAADFADHGLSEITRIAIHPEEKWLAVVAMPESSSSP